MNIKDEAVEAAKRIRDTAMQQTLAARIPESGHFGAIAQDADWLVDHLSAALPHMGGGSTKVFEHKGRVYFYEWRSDRWRNWWGFIGSQPVASHEPAPTDTQEGLSVTGEVVAWRAPINPHGQPSFTYTRTEEELVRFGHHQREPLVRQSALTACQQEVERLRAELIKSRNYWSEQCSGLNRHNAELVKALKPFADAIFNDNGDVTCNYAAFDDDDLFRAYSLLKRAALKGQSNE